MRSIKLFISGLFLCCLSSQAGELSQKIDIFADIDGRITITQVATGHQIVIAARKWEPQDEQKLICLSDYAISWDTKKFARYFADGKLEIYDLSFDYTLAVITPTLSTTTITSYSRHGSIIFTENNKYIKVRINPHPIPYGMHRGSSTCVNAETGIDIGA